jgi:hypothetical protein
MLAEDIERNVSGIGVAKSAFSAALFGATETYCLDVWGTRYAAVIIGAVEHDVDTWQDAYARCRNDGKACTCNACVAEDIRSSWAGTRRNRWDVYRAIGDATFGDAYGQWSFFASADPVFDADGHASFFATVL